jgi:ribosomal-protein-alanine N-acetyltransferase
MATIKTARLTIRPFEMDDLDVYHGQIYSDADVTRYLPGGRPRLREETEDVIAFFIHDRQREGFSINAVIENASGQLIGHCGLHRLKEDRSVEVGYSFGKAHWGKGYATEAAYAALRYGFETLELRRIIALAMPPNIASQRVMQKLGMQYQGVTDVYYHAELALYTLERLAFMIDESDYQVIDDSDHSNS